MDGSGFVDVLDIVVILSSVAAFLCSTVFIWGLSTRTVWWKKFCGVGWFLMAIPVGGVGLSVALMLYQWGTLSEVGKELVRIFINCFIVLVVTGFTAILYKRNNVIEVDVVREEIIKEG